MAEPLSPEEKLLKVIKSGKRDPSLSVPRPAAREAAALQKSVSFQERLSRANRILLIVAGVLLLALIAQGVAFTLAPPGALSARPLKERPVPAEPVALPPPLKPASEYASIGQRDFFKPIAGAEAAGTASAPQSNLILSGIMREPKPVAILQDNETKQSYILGEGESAGGVTVKQILENKVILTTGGLEWELSL